MRSRSQGPEFPRVQAWNSLPARVHRVTLANGQRELWRELTAADPAGVYKISPVAITPDGNAYAYTALRVLSELYLTEGVY